MQILAPLNNDPRPELQRIEIASSFQLPGFHIIGLPAPEVSEAKERIRAALESCGFELPRRRVVLNLAPASIRKRGTGLDLAMALAVLSLELHPGSDERIAGWGEVSLDGSIKPAGQLTRAVYAAWQGNVSRLFICEEEYPLASQAVHWVRQAGFFSAPAPLLVPVPTLQSAWEWLQSKERPNPAGMPSQEHGAPEPPHGLLPLSPSLERTICVAALGGHNLLLLGPKGTGKSHALEWLIALQPEIPDRMRVHHRLLLELSLPKATRELPTPVRRVGCAVRASALIGTLASGQARPGEFSLAHGGILVADEFPEWSRDSREALREPLERGVITLTRSKESIEFPAQFSLAANGNLCPCGGWPAEFPLPFEAQNPKGSIPRCRCTRSQRSQYRSRMSGPILDRMDLVQLITGKKPEGDLSTAAARYRRIRDQVRKARESAIDFWGGTPAHVSPAQLEGFLEERPHWRKCLDELNLLSLRSRHKVVRVALSLAVWDGTSEPQPGHFVEASCYRPERFGLCD